MVIVSAAGFPGRAGAAGGFSSGRAAEAWASRPPPTARPRANTSDEASLIGVVSMVLGTPLARALTFSGVGVSRAVRTASRARRADTAGGARAARERTADR